MKEKSQYPKTISVRGVYERRKKSLIQLLGGACVQCGSILDLTFDHIEGRNWDIRAVSSTKRLRIYTEEAKEGKVQLLCLSCNSSKGDPRISDKPF